MKLEIERLEERDAPAVVAGVFYQDWNANAAHDPGEPGIAGKDIYLASGEHGWVISASTFKDARTAADGSFAFTGLAPGVYTIWENYFNLPGLRQVTTNHYTVAVGLADLSGFDFGYAPVIDPVADANYAAVVAAFMDAFGEPWEGWSWSGQDDFQAGQDAKAFWDSLGGDVP